jgi:hypothetical protein
MTALAQSSVVGLAALAASDGWLAGPAAVVSALGHGLRAARFGRALPLALLLDVWTLPGLAGYEERAWRPPPAGAAALEDYDRWLRVFCAEVAVGMGTPRGAVPDYLPALLDAWPRPPAAHAGPRLDPLAADRAYRELADNRAAQAAILTAWQGPRRLPDSAWQAWFPPLPTKPAPCLSLPARFWAGYGSVRSELLHETCDHDAARMYLESADPALLPDQARRIASLRRRQPAAITLPVVTTPEEPALHYGAISLATLSAGETGELQIVNNTDIRRNRDLPALPPPEGEIHLCWAHGYSGLVASRRQSPASVLQGLAALLIDDWRACLTGLPLRFYAHCGDPNGTADYLGPPGARWKYQGRGAGERDANDRCTPGPPLPGIAVRFFTRRTWTELPLRPLRWSPPEKGGSAYWIACLLACDLAEFGFKRDPDHDWTWQGPADALPEWIQHAIVLAPGDVSVICRVVLHKPERHVVLSPLPLHRLANSDSSYCVLRQQALDVVLDALECLGH